MAHGSKKWIVAYDGKIKRSRHRTKQDYYRDIKWWSPDEGYKYTWKGRQVKFCPQCKHVRKAIEGDRRNYREWWDARYAEYNALYGEAVKAWRHYRLYGWDEYYSHLVGTDGYPTYFAPRPKMPEPPEYYKWVREHYDNGPTLWSYDWRSYLCWKCERKEELRQEGIWAKDSHGSNANYQWVRKQEYRNYRNEVKDLMRKAKYDEEYYEDIPVYKHGWLD